MVRRISILLVTTILLAGCESLPPPKPVCVAPMPDNRPPPVDPNAQPGPGYISTPAGTVTQANKIPPTDEEEALKPFDEWSEQHAAADALGRIGPPAVPDLIQALRNRDPVVRKQAAEVLARMGSDAKPAVPDLVHLLDDEDESIRKEAARTLGRIGPDAAAAVPALMRTLLQPDPLPPDDRLPR
jgi:hypothetical protein